jgi:hypothetical protein
MHDALVQVSQINWALCRHKETHMHTIGKQAGIKINLTQRPVWVQAQTALTQGNCKHCVQMAQQKFLRMAVWLCASDS